MQTIEFKDFHLETGTFRDHDEAPDEDEKPGLRNMLRCSVAMIPHPETEGGLRVWTQNGKVVDFVPAKDLEEEGSVNFDLLSVVFRAHAADSGQVLITTGTKIIINAQDIAGIETSGNTARLTPREGLKLEIPLTRTFNSEVDLQRFEMLVGKSLGPLDPRRETRYAPEDDFTPVGAL